MQGWRARRASLLIAMFGRFTAHVFLMDSSSLGSPRKFWRLKLAKKRNLESVAAIYDWLVEQRAERRDPIIAFGGGVVGDMVGFVAATYLRGVPLVQIPTTVLAQVDSSVGGKTGIDHPRGKNLIGAFYDARIVISDISTLETLPDRERRAGLAEVAKMAAILDADMFARFERESSALARGEPVPHLCYRA